MRNVFDSANEWECIASQSGSDDAPSPPNGYFRATETNSSAGAEMDPRGVRRGYREGFISSMFSGE